MKPIQPVIKTFLCIVFVGLMACVEAPKTKVIPNAVVNNSLQEFPLEIAEPTLDSAKLDINFKPKGEYSTMTSRILSDRPYFKRLYQTNSAKAIDSASQYLYSKLLNTIVPHWYGTEWDFNGHTNIPNQGEIACGYFVSTTLKHLGFNLNRYKMAQQAGLIEAQMLQPKAQLQIFSNLSFESLKAKVNSVYTDGVYFVGLDNHVGYVLVKNKELYFLHSSYYDDKVMIELAETSPCFPSNIYVFAEVSTNKHLVKRWIFNERLQLPNP
ncbi:hypothetical protein [Psychroserpens sp. SPM9]|uniref:hypothetical protein n=1 Tax=Psychroserpens sp. SPM9 TaxID=2975598 RepID=UPI0021A39EDA|nr:hypothetical protein [Psychroserpens sp. SPM9]MDG5490427.1 hypothetical protein [Psychroserpens sp. SPM9]